MGATFLMRMIESTGADTVEAVRAYLAARDIHGLRGLWHEVNDLDDSVAIAHQQSLLHSIRALQEQATRWLLRHPGGGSDAESGIAPMQQAVNRLNEALPGLLTDAAAGELGAARDAHVEAGVPAPLAERLARLPRLYPALDIHAAACVADAELTDAARVHFEAGDALALNDLLAAIDRFQPEDDWQTRYRIGLMESLHEEHRRVTEAILRQTTDGPAATRVEDGLTGEGNRVEYLRQITDQIRASAQPDSAMFGVALQALRHVASNARERLQ